jgi:surfeit locus 1 family protein
MVHKSAPDSESSAPRPISISVGGVLGTLAVFAIAALCVRLGFWQLDRLGERRARNDQLAARLEAAPVALTDVPHDSSGWLYRRVALNGVYDTAGLIIYAGRSLGGVPGAHVVTPLILNGSGSRVLVNRGWLPAADGAHPDLSAIGTSGPVQATGVVVAFPGGRSPPAPPGSITRDTGFRRTWYSIDPEAIRDQYGYPLAPIAVQLVPEDGAPRLPARLPQPALDEGPHKGYAVQWFSFALIAIIGWGALVMKSNARGRSASRNRGQDFIG